MAQIQALKLGLDYDHLFVKPEVNDPADSAAPSEPLSFLDRMLFPMLTTWTSEQLMQGSLELRAQEERASRAVFEQLDGLIGLEPVKEQIRAFANLMKVPLPPSTSTTRPRDRRGTCLSSTTYATRLSY